MALGRGLGELLGEVESAYESNNTHDYASKVVDLDISSIQANPNQPRKIFDEEKLEELSLSIKEHGLLQPVTVIQNEDDTFTLVSGERRLRAHKLAKIDTIKSIVLDIDAFRLREYALIENIQRDDLNIVELAYSYAQLINEHNITHDELAKKVFKSRTSITNTLRLLQLSSYAQQFLASSKISAGHAKVMLGLSDNEQKMVCDSIIGQKLSVRETEKLVKDLKERTNPNKKLKVKNTNFDFKPLSNILSKFEASGLKAKAEKNYLKIEINSQEDIEKISSYFKLQ